MSRTPFEILDLLDEIVLKAKFLGIPLDELIKELKTEWESNE